MAEDSGEESSLSSQIPNFYFDLIARIIPGIIATSFYLPNFNLQAFFEKNTLSIFILSYFVGLILNTLSVDIWRWVYKETPLLRLISLRKLSPYEDRPIWSWLRYEVKPKYRGIFIKMLAELIMLKSTTLISFIWLIYPPSILNNCFQDVRAVILIIFLILFYCMVRANLRIINNKKQYEESNP